jgi:hypothetical protein
VTIDGKSTGSFHVMVTGEGVENEILSYGEQQISENQQATIRLGPAISKPELILPDGTAIQPVETTTRNDLASLHDPLDHLNAAPNPFFERVQLSYLLLKDSPVSLEVYDLTGSLLITLENNFKSSGCYTFNWNGKDADGNPLKSGIYFCRLTTLHGTETCKVICVR